MVEAVGRVGELSAEACRAGVERRFSAAAMLDGYENLYRQIVTNSAGELRTVIV